MEKARFSRKFGDWEAEYDETLVYPSLALQHDNDFILNGNDKEIILNSLPRKWRFRRSDKVTPIKIHNEDEGEETSRKNKLLNKLYEETTGEHLLREKLRQDYLQRLKMETRSLTAGMRGPSGRLEFASISETLLKLSRKPRVIKPIDEKSSALDIYSVLSAKELPQKKRVDLGPNYLYDKHKNLIKDIIPDDNKNIQDAIIHYRVKNEIKLKAQRYENDIAQDFLHQLNNATAPLKVDHHHPHGQIQGQGQGHNNSEAMSFKDVNNVKSYLEYTRAKRALEFNQGGYIQELIDKEASKLSEINTTSTTIASDRDTASDVLSLDNRKMKDSLLVSQIKQGVLPINLLRKIPSTHHHHATEQYEDDLKDNTSPPSSNIADISDMSIVELDITNYSIGDDHGICIGQSLEGIHTIHAIRLHNNRLTDKSLPIIPRNMSTISLKSLDLSNNILTGAGCKALANYFYKNKNILENMNLSKCSLVYTDIQILFHALGSMKHQLHTLNLSSNALTIDGLRAIGKYLTNSDVCTLTNLDVSWNEIHTEGGGKLIAESIRKNDTLLSLNISANGITDIAGQIIIHSLGDNYTLENLNMSKNKIGSKSCFVLAKVLRHHEGLKYIDLSENTLCEPGARSLFRDLLHGLQVTIRLHDCDFAINDVVFNYSNPEFASPYELNLDIPYDAAIFDQLIIILKRKPSTRFESVLFKESKNYPEISLNLIAINNDIINIKNNSIWVIPTTGIIKVNFQHRIIVPTPDMSIKNDHFEILIRIIIEAKSFADRIKFMTLLFSDILCTTDQVVHLLTILKKTKVLKFGDIVKKDIFIASWERIIDTENKFPLVYSNFSREERRELATILTFETYRFSWFNATGCYNLNLANSIQYNLMLQISAINKVESDYGKNLSKRGDTSQHGNWSNFRNERYHSEEIVISDSFLSKIPRKHRISFDYVSTSRPLSNKSTTVSMEQLSELLHQIGLSRTSLHLERTELAFILIELQMAASKYYFLVKDVLQIVEAFISTFHHDTLRLAPKIIVAIFSRIYDLHNFDHILKHVSLENCHEIAKKLGWLNIMNPLKPSHNFYLPMKYYDNRVIIVMFLELSGTEGGEQIKMAPNTDIKLVDLYGKIGRIIQLQNWKETTIMSYCEFGEQTKIINWSARKDLMKKFLVGSFPSHPELYQIIDMHTQLEAAGALHVGAIDLQHREFINKLFSF